MNAQTLQPVLDAMTSFGGAVVRASWQASVLAVLVLAVQRMLRGRVAARWLYLMWGLVLLRLALPAVPASPVSVFNLAARWTHERNNSVVVASAAPVDVVWSAPAIVTAPHSQRIDPQPIPAAAPAIAPAPATTITWRHWLAMAWAGGVIILALRVAWASVRVGRFVRDMGRADDPAADALLRDCAAAVGVRRVPELRCDVRVHGPALVGWIRPKLLLPQSVVDDFDPTELRMIFLHELAHQRRRDVLVNWIATGLQVVHWFNPAVWLVMWRVRTDREVACDELVLSLTRGADRRAYGRTILKLLETLPDRAGSRGALAPAAVAGTGVGILEGKQQMKRRITMIAQFGTTTRRWTAVAAVLALALGGVALTDAVQAQAPEKPSATQPATGPSQAALKALWKYDTARQLLSKKSITPQEHDAALRDLRQEITEKEMVRLPNGQIANKLDVDRLVNEAQKNLAEVLEERRQTADAAAQTAGAAAFAVAEDDDPDSAAARKQLEVRLPELKFDGIPFTDAIDFLRDVTGANIFVNWRALEEAGIDRQAPVSARLRDVRFRDGLDNILRDVGGGTVKLGHTIERGVITISTDEDLSRNVLIKVYEVGDLLTPAKPPATQPTVEQKGEQLMQLIQNMIAQDSWRDAGGTVGGISVFETRLVVNQTPQNHEKIEAFLKQLRSAKPAAK